MLGSGVEGFLMLWDSWALGFGFRGFGVLGFRGLGFRGS